MSKRGDSKKESSRAKSRKAAAAAKPSKARNAKPAKAQAATAGRKSGGGLLTRVITAVAGALKRRPGKASKAAAATKPAPTRKNNGGTAKAARVTRREADIPMDQIASTYTPTQTSLKAGFRATGADRSRDQEFAGGVANDRWKDEDRITNKSGDPRIGTHGRTYEPGEKAKPSRSDNDDE
jgi:hypothetical protein